MPIAAWRRRATTRSGGMESKESCAPSRHESGPFAFALVPRPHATAACGTRGRDHPCSEPFGMQNGKCSEQRSGAAGPARSPPRARVAPKYEGTSTEVSSESQLHAGAVHYRRREATAVSSSLPHRAGPRRRRCHRREGSRSRRQKTTVSLAATGQPTRAQKGHVHTTTMCGGPHCVTTRNSSRSSRSARSSAV